MRPIKFRAWDTNKQRMVLPVENETCGNNQDAFAIQANGKVCWIQYELVETDGLIPMQFIGLHDRNGKEIYEGDIIVGDARDSSRVYEIKWDNSDASWLMVAPQQDPPWPRVYRAFDIKYGEVIGNIYQNPELLVE